MKSFVLIAAAAAVALPFSMATAQVMQPSDNMHMTDPHQPENDGSAAASATVAPGQVAPGVDPGTGMANARVSGDIQAVHTANANNRAQYDADLASYDQAMASHDRQSAHYAHQKRAYADAMEAWRAQVDACQHGSHVACNAPAPDPASFY